MTIALIVNDDDGTCVKSIILGVMSGKVLLEMFFCDIACAQW